jgi:peptide/nickel transport system permease protein
VSAAATAAPQAVRVQGSTSRVLRRVVRQPLAMTGLLFLVALALVAIFAPAIVPYGEGEQHLTNGLKGISGEHLLGTDNLGRDTFSRLVFGARVTLQAAFQAVFVAGIIGIPIGLLVGYKGGWFDRIVMRVADVGDAVPGILLAFAVIAVLGRGLTNAMIAVGLIFVTGYIRMTRALVLAEREKLYVDAAKVGGLRTSNILLRQLLPNVGGPLIVQTAIFAGRAVLIEAALSFLGLGLDVTRASWGGMLSAATSYSAIQPLLPWPPGLAITFTVLAFNLVGDGLRDALGGEKALTLRATGQRRLLVPKRPRRGAELQQDEASGTAAVLDEDVVLAVKNLTVQFPHPDRDRVTIVDNVSFALRAGETLGLVGESGSGKSMTGLAIMGLLPRPGVIEGGSVRLAGRELTTLTDNELTAVRGDDIAMIFQDPLVALSPVHSVGRQLTQAVRNHREMSGSQARERAIELLGLVGVPSAEKRMSDYPHQFSGGMAQRVVIAMALAGEPKVLIADEPTTALDVTIQRQVLELLDDLKERFGMAVLLITHDLGVVAGSCDRGIVMYAGQIVETAPVESLFERPQHPYTGALLQAMPRNSSDAERLPTIEGRVPAPWDWPNGCRFHPRCAYAQDACGMASIPLDDGARCVRQHEIEVPGAREEALT